MKVFKPIKKPRKASLYDEQTITPLEYNTRQDTLFPILEEKLPALTKLQERLVTALDFARDEGNSKEERLYRNRAIHYLKQSLEIIRDYFGEDSPHATKIQFKLDNLVKPTAQ